MHVLAAVERIDRGLNENIKIESSFVYGEKKSLFLKFYSLVVLILYCCGHVEHFGPDH